MLCVAPWYVYLCCESGCDDTEYQADKLRVFLCFFCVDSRGGLTWLMFTFEHFISHVLFIGIKWVCDEFASLSGH